MVERCRLKLNRKRRKIFNWLSKKSLVQQVTLIYSVIILVPSIIIGVGLTYTLYVDRVDEESRNNSQYVQQIRRNILNSMQLTESLALKFHFDTELQYYLYYGDESRVKDIYYGNYSQDEKRHYLFHGRMDADKKSLVQAYLDNLDGALPKELVSKQMVAFQRSVNGAKYSNPELLLHTTISLYSENYLIKEDRASLIWHADKVNHQAFYKELTEEEDTAFWGRVRQPFVIRDSAADYKVMPSEGWVVPYYSKILRPSNKEYLGFLEFDMRLDRMAMIQNVTSGIENAYKNSQILVLWNDNGQVCYTSNAQANEHYLSMPKVSGVGKTEVSVGDQQYSLVYETMDDIGLSIGVLQPIGIIIEQVMPGVVILSTALVGGMILVIALSRKVAQNLFLRLVALDRHIERQKLDGSFEQMVVSGQDEIARITSSFNTLMYRLNDMVSGMVERETAQRDAEMRALQAQINPHFLYNTLENLRMQCEMDEYYTISDKLFSLSKLMQYSIKRRMEQNTLGDELQALENYANLMEMRVSLEVELNINVDKEILAEHTPKMILQPMLENCFAHAIPRKKKHFRIDIEGKLNKNGYLIITVKDNGKGMDKARLNDIRSQLREGKEMLSSGSIGLTNVNKRIRMKYGEKSGLKIYSSGRGTMICMIIKRNQ